jgi:hypothetical protein
MNMKERRTMLLGLSSLALLQLAGCANKPPRPVNPDGTYCFSSGNTWRYKTCTTEPVPAAAVEMQAKRFEPSPGALTLYIVRNRSMDLRNLVIVSFDERTRVATIPESLTRVRMKPGEHRLTVEWRGRVTEWRVSGAAGEVRFAELVTPAWAWHSHFHLEEGSPEASRGRAQSARLIADIDLRVIGGG